MHQIIPILSHSVRVIDSGRLAIGDPNYASQLQLARRSQERQHPVGVSFGEAHAVTELVRADNDVPKELWDEDADRALVLFEGHDGVFRVKTEHPEYARIRALIAEAPPAEGPGLVHRSQTRPGATRCFKGRWVGPDVRAMTWWRACGLLVPETHFSAT